MGLEGPKVDQVVETSKAECNTFYRHQHDTDPYED